MRTSIPILLSFVLCAVGLFAQQGDENLSRDRPESWTMRYFTAAGLMLGNGPPADLSKNGFAVGIEMVDLPRLSESERMVGFNGTKEENLNKAPFIVRPLLHWKPSERLSFTGSYVPPVEVFNRLQTHLAGLFVNYDLLRGDPWRIRLRLGGQWTEAKADFTCAEEIAGIMDPDVNPFGCIEPSHDTFTNVTGTIEVLAAYRIHPEHPMELFGSVAYSYADMDFDINALWAGGFEDRRRLSNTGDIWVFGLGVEFRLQKRLRARIGAYHAPLQIRRPPEYEDATEPLTHFRLSLQWLL